MGTRAGIQFRDEWNTVFHVYRGHDGTPENVMRDLERLIVTAKDRWSGSEVGCLVTMFLAMNWDVTKERLPDYEITEGWHTDEGRRYEVVYELEQEQPRFGSRRGRWVAREIAVER